MEENQRVPNTEDIDYNRKFVSESITDIKNGRTVFVYKQRVLDSLIMKLETLDLFYEVRRVDADNCWEVKGDYKIAVEKVRKQNEKKKKERQANEL